MQVLLDWQDRLGQRTVTTARTSQAFAIAAMDRLVGSTPEEPSVVSRILQVELDVVGAVTGEPGRVVDQSYDVLQRLVVLHREFARRLFEVVDARDEGVATSDRRGRLATVLPLHRVAVRPA